MGFHGRLRWGVSREAAVSRHVADAALIALGHQLWWGLNSTAVIIECRKRGMKPDWIIFADTARVIPVLRNLGRATDCVELSRLVHDDSSAIYRILCKDERVRATFGKDLTRFEYVR